MDIIKHDDENVKCRMSIFTVFSRLFGAHDEDFIVTFPRMQDSMCNEIIMVKILVKKS